MIFNLTIKVNHKNKVIYLRMGKLIWCDGSPVKLKSEEQDGDFLSVRTMESKALRAVQFFAFLDLFNQHIKSPGGYVPYTMWRTVDVSEKCTLEKFHATLFANDDTRCFEKIKYNPFTQTLSFTLHERIE